MAEELDVVKRAWREEGDDLRAKMLEVHKAKLASDEAAHASAAREADMYDAASSLKSEVRRTERMAHVSKESLASEARNWERRAADSEASAAQTQNRLLESEASNHSLTAELTVIKEQMAQLRSQCRRAEEENRLLQQKIVKMHTDREEERRMWRVEVSKCEAEAIAQRQQVESERQAKAAEAVASRATALTLDRKLARREADIKRMMDEWDAREEDLAADLHAQMRRAVAAEAERDAARAEAARYRAMLDVSSQDMASIFNAVNYITVSDETVAAGTAGVDASVDGARGGLGASLSRGGHSAGAYSGMGVGMSAGPAGVAGGGPSISAEVDRLVAAAGGSSPAR